MAIARDKSVGDRPAVKQERTQKTAKELFEIRKAMMRKRHTPSTLGVDANGAVEHSTTPQSSMNVFGGSAK